MSGCHEEISNVRDCHVDASFTYPADRQQTFSVLRRAHSPVTFELEAYLGRFESP